MEVIRAGKIINGGCSLATFQTLIISSVHLKGCRLCDFEKLRTLITGEY
jgi:hypothetical protein